MRVDRRKVSIFFLMFSLCVSIKFAAFCQDKKYPFSDNDREPFSPLISKGGIILIPQKIEFAGMALKGIIYSEGKPLAIINEEVLKEGDKIGEYTVLKINKKSVTRKKNNEAFILKLEE